MSKLVFVVEDDKDSTADRELKKSISKLSNLVLAKDGKNVSYSHEYDRCFAFGRIPFLSDFYCNVRYGALDLHCKSSECYYHHCFRYTKSLELFKEKHINADHFSVTPVEDLLKNKWDFYRIYAEEAKIFVRPDSTYKLFNGGLFDIEDIDREFESIDVFKDTLCVVSSPKKIRAEWRLVCSSEKVITGSLYLYQGLRALVKGYPPAVEQLAKYAIDKIGKSPMMFVVDICLMESGEYKIVELNPINSAGLYACDRDKIVEEIIRNYDLTGSN